MTALAASLHDEVRDAIDATGWALIPGAPVDDNEATAEILAAVSTWVQTDDIAPTLVEGGDLSTTYLAFPPHTDSAFRDDPHHFVTMGCIERSGANIGGVTRLYDWRRLQPQLDAGVLELLRQPAYMVRSASRPWPIVTDAGIRYRRDLTRATSAAHADALRALDRLVAAADPDAEFTLVEGDLLIMDNRRILHERTAIVEGSWRRLRHLRGYAPDWQAVAA